MIDEFYGSWMKYNVLLRVLDGHPLRLEVKGGFTWAAYTHVFITSNACVGAWYHRDDISALKRRITEVIDCDDALYDDIELPADEEPKKLGKMRVEVFHQKMRDGIGAFAEMRHEKPWCYQDPDKAAVLVPDTPLVDTISDSDE